MRIAHNSTFNTQHSTLNIQHSTLKLVPAEYVASIDLVFNVLQAIIKAVGNDGFALCLELVKIINDFAAEECSAVFKCWLVDNYFCTLCLYTLHDALDGRLTEVVTV